MLDERFWYSCPKEQAAQALIQRRMDASLTEYQQILLQYKKELFYDVSPNPNETAAKFFSRFERNIEDLQKWGIMIPEAEMVDQLINCFSKMTILNDVITNIRVERRRDEGPRTLGEFKALINPFLEESMLVAKLQKEANLTKKIDKASFIATAEPKSPRSPRINVVEKEYGTCWICGTA